MTQDPLKKDTDGRFFRGNLHRVEYERLDAKALLDALKAGRYFST